MRTALVAATVVALVAGCEKRERPSTPATVQMGVRFTAIDGRVRVKRAQTLAWTDASLAVTVARGDLISTDRDSSAKLQFNDGSLFDVRPDSLITILENSTDELRRPHVGVGIESGEAHFNIPPDVGDRAIETPSGRAAPDRATEGNVLVARGGRATIGVVRGRARVQSNTGRQLDVGPRESLVIDSAGQAELRPSTAAPLPPPVALAPNPAGVWSGVLRPPRLAVDTIELRGRQLHVAGRTEPGVTLTVNGVRIPVQGDGSFGEHVVVVDDAAVISVRAAAEGGGTTEQRLPVARR